MGKGPDPSVSIIAGASAAGTGCLGWSDPAPTICRSGLPLGIKPLGASYQDHKYIYTHPPITYIYTHPIYVCIYTYNLGLFLVSAGSGLPIQLEVFPEMTLLQIFRFLKKPIRVLSNLLRKTPGGFSDELPQVFLISFVCFTR